MRYIVTSGLPYANASLHLGHILEIIQTDVWVRCLNLDSQEAYYFCASDTHGTPVMLKAKELNTGPEDLVSSIKNEHENTFKNFNVNLSNFHTTHSEENKEITLKIFSDLLKSKNIYKKKIVQLYDEQENIFLSDRFVKGTCPSCGAKEQYGDACEVCSSTYDALDLINPMSTLSESRPIKKESTHYFFSLSNFKSFLEKNVAKLSKQEPVVNKINEWLNGGLKDWDVSRDEPYFGFKVPGEEKKYIYVWLDAPIGYLSSVMNWCKTNNKDFNEFLSTDTKLVHFIGKDIIYFHMLFWPATLHAAKQKLPDEVFVHGFMTIEGNKMSKSRGNYITADAALNYADADFYRYYISSKLNDDVSDMDFSIKDFIQKINSDLVGKFVNIPSRTSKFINKLGSSQIILNSTSLNNKYHDTYKEIISCTKSRSYSKAIKLIMSVADDVNSYISSEEPWTLAKNNKNEECLKVCSNALVVFSNLNILLSPFIPKIANKLSKFLNIKNMEYDNVFSQNISEINEYTHIINRLEEKDFEGMINYER